ncbi:hypothetical protein GGI25_006184 [Coemansia spiralis]|uniref:Uncharacterized protein n=2 Tax=Coemansia TaxID=4863 RepID=A0A9W8KVJ0_9FUNG|nr:hypothetical protein BX070DRAFT_237493 [Coemansia spiralis]KAJ1988182.1 hypothetical protein EDC05_005447 [Coemansia umbellata]KAJ2619781.1 hypothetical protein GGI26_005543 [Coemansia sp. RSA 1358]KAJ2669332.1 hypothetical protein GGI25_006184 [Coemansia spiralis]
MRYALRTRQALLVVVGTAYVFVMAWFNRQPIPTTTLVHESDSSLKLRQTRQTHLASGNRDAHWLEPASYLPDNTSVGRPPGVMDIESGLLHIRLHTEYRTARPGEPLAGLVKVYRKNLKFIGATQNDKESPWELLFVDRLPGPVKQSHLDRTRLRNDDGSYAPRHLSVLYYMPMDETMVFRTRIYNLESLDKAPFFDKAVDTVGSMWKELHKSTNTKDEKTALNTKRIACDFYLCPNDNVSFADKVYSSTRFSHCVGPSGMIMSYIDFALPGTLDVVEFSLRGRILMYSRLNDMVRFRVLVLPATKNGTLINDSSAIVQSKGPAVTEYLRNIGSQSFLTQLHSTRPNEDIDVFLVDGDTVSDTFFFSFSFLQNITFAKKWSREDIKRYRLPVHQQFSGLSRDELRLVNDPPLIDQAGLTSVFYFKATDIIVTVDTEWFHDHESNNVTQLQRVRESRPPYISTLNSPVAVNMTLDDSGALLAMSTVDDELFIFSRAHTSSIKHILDYRRYFRLPNLLPWVATESISSIDTLEEGETDVFNWQLKLTWQPSTLMSVVNWEDGFISPDNPFPTTQRFIARAQQQQPTATCLRFLHFDPAQLAQQPPGSDASSLLRIKTVIETGGKALDAASGSTICVVALSASGRVRLWELDSHKQSPHVLWPFITEHWGLMFMLAAVVCCCVYNERRWG